ncbi:MAG: hypothetical protein IJK67_06100 [Bacilli bacterium]|nr:hypothetical protein [Bacilli bacterium]
MGTKKEYKSYNIIQIEKDIKKGKAKSIATFGLSIVLAGALAGMSAKNFINDNYYESVVTCLGAFATLLGGVDRSIYLDRKLDPKREQLRRLIR